MSVKRRKRKDTLLSTILVLYVLVHVLVHVHEHVQVLGHIENSKQKCLKIGGEKRLKPFVCLRRAKRKSMRVEALLLEREKFEPNVKL